MTNTIQKQTFSQPVCWISTVKRIEIQRKKASSLINGNLYHYAGNNPIRYIDPDGRIDLPFLSPTDFFNFLVEHDSGAKAAKIYVDAASGDKAAQAVAKDITIATGQEIASDVAQTGIEMAVETLEATATVSAVSGEVLSDVALVSALVRPDFSIELGKASTVCSGIEVAARTGKAAITGDQADIDKAKETFKKNGGSIGIGFGVGQITKNCSKGISNLLSGIASKIYEKVIDNSNKKKEE